MKFILKSRYVIMLCVVIAILLTGITAFGLQSNKFFNLGQKINKINKVNDTSIVALVGDTKITKKTFDTFKELYSPGDNIPSDVELLDKLIEKEIIYQQAIRNNISVSEEEINRALQEQKDIVFKDAKAKGIFENLIQGKNISEKEYWEKMKDGVKKGLIRGKYINKLKDEFRKESPNMQESEFQSKFKEHYNNKINSLKNATKVEKFIK